MDFVATPQNLELACQQVYKNKGAAGIDGITVYDIDQHIQQYGEAILRKVRDGTYQPQPVRRVYIPKENGDKRALGIPVVRDRIVQQMILNVMDSYIDSDFSTYSYGFRKGKGAHDAVRQMKLTLKKAMSGWLIVTLRSTLIRSIIKS